MRSVPRQIKNGHSMRDQGPRHPPRCSSGPCMCFAVPPGLDEGIDAVILSKSFGDVEHFLSLLSTRSHFPDNHPPNTKANCIFINHLRKKEKVKDNSSPSVKSRKPPYTKMLKITKTPLIVSVFLLIILARVVSASPIPSIEPRKFHLYHILFSHHLEENVPWQREWHFGCSE